MKKKLKVAFLILASIVIAVQIGLFISSQNMVVLEPRGLIAAKQRELLIITTLLMLTVVIPALALAVIVCCKYRASNKKAKYVPTWDNSTTLEFIWWGFPCLIVLLLSILTWKSCLELDPFKPLDSNVKPLKVQVVALQWKWLFIYPEQNIASVNLLEIPEKTPINFEITSDAPMNSFWIPELGGQIYAMPGMTTKLHLIADQTGNYRGSSANLSGLGFSKMIFTTKATSLEDFEAWVSKVKESGNPLSLEKYKELCEPSIPPDSNPVTVYSQVDEDLYDGIVMKYMMP